MIRTSSCNRSPFAQIGHCTVTETPDDTPDCSGPGPELSGPGRRRPESFGPGPHDSSEADPAVTVRSVFIVDPDKKVRLALT
jgi:hypothetical protein